MLFTSEQHGMWDTWIYPHDGKYYLFWLQDKYRANVLPHKIVWDSIALAVSEDLLHWKEIGTVIEKAPDADNWMGTGRTWKVRNKFYMNFSEYRQNIQSIYFAESDDLITWKRLDHEYRFDIDDRWYVSKLEETPEPWVRWDCLCPVRKADGSYVGFFSSHSKHKPIGARAVVGAATSSDGVNWIASQPASDRSEPSAEVSGYVCFEDRHYVTISNTEAWGPRYDNGQSRNGMWYWVSDNLEGPYGPPKHDHFLHGQRASDFSAYFGTAFKDGDKWLWNHHWNDTEGILWLGTIKELKEEAPGRLALYYWDGNENLKGECVIDSNYNLIPHYPPAYPERPVCASWNVKDGVLTGSTERASGLAVIEVPQSVEQGCIISCDINIGKNNGDGAGLFIGGTKELNATGIAILLNPEGKALLGKTIMGFTSPRLMYWEDFDIDIFIDRKVHILAIVKKDFVEIYANNKLLRTLSMSKDQCFDGKFGLWIDRCSASMDNLKVWNIVDLS